MYFRIEIIDECFENWFDRPGHGPLPEATPDYAHETRNVRKALQFLLTSNQTNVRRGRRGDPAVKQCSLLATSNFLGHLGII